jgi:hypothetical protein
LRRFQRRRLAPSVKAFGSKAPHDFLVRSSTGLSTGSRCVASVENGADFLRPLQSCGTATRCPAASPRSVETFRRNIWINLFWEDDVRVVELRASTADLRSDWPTSRDARPSTTRQQAQGVRRRRPRKILATTRGAQHLHPGLRGDGRHRDDRLLLARHALVQAVATFASTHPRTAPLASRALT